MDRRSFIRTAGVAGVGSAAALAAPAVAQGRKEMVIVSTWPRDFPGLGTGAQRLAANIEKLSEGGSEAVMLTTKFAADIELPQGFSVYWMIDQVQDALARELGDLHLASDSSAARPASRCSPSWPWAPGSC